MKGASTDVRLERVKFHILAIFCSTEIEEKIDPRNIYPSVQHGIDAYLIEHSRKPEMVN